MLKQIYASASMDLPCQTHTVALTKTPVRARACTPRLKSTETCESVVPSMDWDIMPRTSLAHLGIDLPLENGGQGIPRFLCVCIKEEDLLLSTSTRELNTNVSCMPSDHCRKINAQDENNQRYYDQSDKQPRLSGPRPRLEISNATSYLSRVGIDCS